MTERADVAVIGAGIVGVSTALHLLRRGKKVILIDRKEPGRETSYGNAGILETACVLPFSFPPISRWPRILLNHDTMARIDYPSLPQCLPWIVKFFFASQPEPMRRNGQLMWPLIAHAIDEHRNLMRGTDADKHFIPTGRIAIYRSKESFAASTFQRKTAKEFGVPFDVIENTAIKEFEPHLKPAFHKAIRWTGTARINNPGAIVSAYARRFASEGGTILKDDVRTLELAEDWRIETPSQTIRADEIVICTGPWSTEVLKPLGYRFPLGLKRGYHRHYHAAENAALSHAISDIDCGYALTSMEQGFRITTGAEFASLHAPPNSSQLGYILPRAREIFPLGEPAEPQTWYGSRPCFTDSMPVIGPAALHKGLWYNFGHGHVGLTAGPASGRLLAEMLTKAPTFCDPTPYRASRFGC